jgi:hypothetical protein
MLILLREPYDLWADIHMQHSNSALNNLLDFNVSYDTTSTVFPGLFSQTEPCDSIFDSMLTQCYVRSWSISDLLDTTIPPIAVQSSTYAIPNEKCPDSLMPTLEHDNAIATMTLNALPLGGFFTNCEIPEGFALEFPDLGSSSMPASNGPFTLDFVNVEPIQDTAKLQLHTQPSSYQHPADPRTPTAELGPSLVLHPQDLQNGNGYEPCPLICMRCSKVFPTKAQLRSHESQHLKQFCCSVGTCTKRHGSQRDLNRHMWSCHESYAIANKVPTEKRRCTVCGMESRNDNVKRHMRTIHGIKDTKRLTVSGG